MIIAAIATVALATLTRWRRPARRLLLHGVGAPPHPRRVHPTADEWASFLDAVAAEVRGGASLSTALHHAERRLGVARPPSAVGSNAPDRDAAIVLQVVEAATTLGGPVAATLGSGASVLRERSAARADLQAHAAQARLSARVLTAVPLGFAVFSAATSASFRSALLSPVGLIVAAVGGACNAVGWWWMRRLIAKATP